MPEQRLPPLMYSPVRGKYFASQDFLAALETVRDGCREIVNNETLNSPVAKVFVELWGTVEALIDTYGSPRPADANKD